MLGTSDGTFCPLSKLWCKSQQTAFFGPERELFFVQSRAQRPETHLKSQMFPYCSREPDNNVTFYNDLERIDCRTSQTYQRMLWGGASSERVRLEHLGEGTHPVVRFCLSSQ